MDKKKIGRPKIDNPKNNRITVRLDTETDNILNMYCKNHNIKDKSEAIRIAIKNLGK